MMTPHVNSLVSVTKKRHTCLPRLRLFFEMQGDDQDRVIDLVCGFPA
jgi:hypothetical protein